jgi:prevent-host-death family protein
MAEVSVRDLYRNGGEILNRVAAAGEVLIVTRNGKPIAELRPLPRQPLRAGQLIERWRRLPTVDPALLRAGIDSALDATL